MDAEEFHRSRRRGSVGGREGRGVVQDDDPPPEGESESLQLRRRSYPPSEDPIDVDPVTGEDIPGRDGEEGGRGSRRRRRRSENVDELGERRDGGGRNGGSVPQPKTGGGGVCPGCGRCDCCGGVATSHYKGAVDGRKEGGGAGSGGRRWRGAPRHGASDASSSEESRRNHRSRPDRRRRFDFDNCGHDDNNDDDDDHRRHVRQGDSHRAVVSGYRSDSSGRPRRRRQSPPLQGREDRLEDGRHHGRRHRDEYIDSRPRPRGSKGDGRQHRLPLGYSSGDASSFEEEPVSPRRRRARREAAAAAVVAAAETSARETSHFTRHRPTKNDGSGGGGGATFSTPFSTPRRHPAAAPSNQAATTWRSGRHSGRGRGEENLRSGHTGDDGARQGYRSLPPPRLPEASTRRVRHRSAAGAAAARMEGRSNDYSSRRRVDRRAREVRIASTPIA